MDLEARYQLPPHLLFELLADPRQHDKIFDAILVSKVAGSPGSLDSPGLHNRAQSMSASLAAANKCTAAVGCCAGRLVSTQGLHCPPGLPSDLTQSPRIV